MNYNYLWAIISAILIPSSLFGWEKKNYTINFDEKDFTYEMVDGLVNIIPQKGDYIIWGDSLLPALPYVIVNVLAAPSENYVGISYNTKEALVMENVIIAPNPIPTQTNIVKTDRMIRKVNYSEKEFPITCVEYTGTHLMDGYKYFSFIVSPFHYDVDNKCLYHCSLLNLELHVEKKLKEVPNVNINIGNNMRSIIKEKMINGNDLEEIYSNVKANTTKTSNRLLGSQSYKYIIVTSETLRPAFERLAQWKTVKGVRAKVITVEDCYEEFPNDTQPLAIKKMLANYYANGMTYALLGGDTNIVPAQLCYLPHLTVNTYDTPSDLYYACLDSNMGWDANGNNIYGELADSVDLAPEFILTRISVSTLLDANDFINRIMSYESFPKLEGWTNSMLSCGNYLQGYKLKNGIKISDAQWQGEYVFENGVLPYWNGSLFKLFDTYTDHPDGASYTANPEHFQTELEKGYTFVDEFSHAWTTVWGALEHSTVYTVDDASELVNCGNSIISTISCYSNAFDKNANDTISLSEAFMRNPNGGILGYYGSSREGWIYTSYYFDKEFYHCLLSGSEKQFGRAATYSKISLLGSAISSTNYNHYRWLEMTLNALGDPEMPVFTSTPQIFQNVVVAYQNGNLNVSTGLDSCRICVSSVADNGNNYYEVVDNVNTGNFINITNDSYLCITKPGFIPYIARVGPTVYLQNESIVRDLSVFSNNSYAGSDVTTEKAQGPVIIEKGKVTNRSSNGVFIKNDFEVKLGAEIEIITNP